MTKRENTKKIQGHITITLDLDQSWYEQMKLNGCIITHTHTFINICPGQTQTDYTDSHFFLDSRKSTPKQHTNKQNGKGGKGERERKVMT